MDEVDDSVAKPVTPEPESDEDIINLCRERFKQSHEAQRENHLKCGEVQEFIAGDQWPQQIKSQRIAADRPCLTLDHLNQYVRHVVNSGLMQQRDVRVLAMSGEADDKVGDMLAGMIRQITQTSTAKVAYETGLRHGCQHGFGYWRVKVQPIPKTNLLEIVVLKIKDSRMVLLDPFCNYPDGRDAQYGFILTKLTSTEFKRQYGTDEEGEVTKSWHNVEDTNVLPWVGQGAIIVAEYYYLDPKDQTMKWCILTPDRILKKGIHHGDVMPIIRVAGDEFEYEGKERVRGMISDSSIDSQRAYNYSSSAFIEAVALAPLAPFVAAEEQIEQYISEWKDAHKTPRAVLRYKPYATGGVLVPPPQRSQPAGIPDGWQGMMTNLISDTQMIMGLAQPSVLGTGGAPVQSGAGINAQQAPGEINTFHYHEHWHMAIEQTGRVILAMIPHVYTSEQAVKITGEDGQMKTAMINPQMEQAYLEEMDQATNKILSTAYNPNIGRYDVAISTGPSSASKKMEANKMLTTVVNADPTIMQKAGDLVVASMDMAGADVLAKRLKSFLPPGTTDEPTGQAIMIQQLQEQLKQLQQDNQDMNQIILAEREKSKAALMEANMDNQTALAEERLKGSAALQEATQKVQAELEMNLQDNIVKVLIAKLNAKSKIDVEVIKSFTAATKEKTSEGRSVGYAGVLEKLNQEDSNETTV